MTTNELEQLATSLNITLTTHNEGNKGWYHHDSNTISLRSDLRAANYRCTLAHELAHALAGDEPTGIDHFDRRMERAADMVAANMLIAPEDYETAETLYGPHAGAIARELGVTRHLLTVWQDSHEKECHYELA
ncbi:ImmA/IrrE family metallo-endopeptidase [Corynebacterium amycolatum]|uniref:ImmA/IrrE family metallo-endopeptidase n=1 Tax=Corynebacterium amycolatum TaxID=43765 RepID=UPI00191E4455|nr:ImmA/IrrE family metallo-endopeptidase [Corynebacterium amycolatum]QQU97755.1 ImmA/IrrE family metallo-endopeptidase [Corynebacterium amycolatum]